MGLSPVDVVRRFADRISDMKREGETWYKVSEMIETETGETLSVPVLRATYSRIGRKPMKSVSASAKRSTAKPIQTEPTKPKPPEKADPEPQIVTVQPVPAIRLESHLARLIGHRSELPGWTNFLTGEAINRLRTYSPLFDLNRLPNIQLNQPISDLLLGLTLRQFGRFQAEKIDVNGFRDLDQIGKVGQEVRDFEKRVLEHFKQDRRALFCAMAEEFFRADQDGFAAWFLGSEGLGYYNSLQFLDYEITAGRQGHLLARCRRWTKNVHQWHVERGWADLAPFSHVVLGSDSS